MRRNLIATSLALETLRLAHHEAAGAAKERARAALKLMRQGTSGADNLRFHPGNRPIWYYGMSDRSGRGRGRGAKGNKGPRRDGGDQQRDGKSRGGWFTG